MIVEQLMAVVALGLLAALLLTLAFLASRWRKAKPDRSATAADSSRDSERVSRTPEADLSRDDVHGLMSRIGAAFDQNQPQALAPLHLALARAHIKDGREGDALAELRSAAGLAALHGPPKIHAEVRLELAEVAFRAGDLTSACEHWQMARSALQDDGQDEGAHRVERRMRDNGCPTDWVLTDF